ncbi:MAG TPA: arsenite methyltransferase [Polyangia bacterium]|jgi:SAM-dependent methyltransferase
MSEHDQTRRQVSESYARAVTGGGSCCGGPRAPQPTPTTLAGYTSGEVAGLPDDAVASSFGCGNPVAFTEVRPGQVVVDLGSGAGIDLLLAARKVGPTGRVGVDMTDAMIERARANVQAAGLTNVEVRRGIIEELPVETGTVDWVISNCVINLSPEKPRVFREIARVLRPGGRMLVSDLVVDDLPAWARASAALYAACIGGAVGEAEYLAGLRAAGLVDVEVRDRLVYDAAQLRALAPAELGAAAGGCGCGGGPVDDKVVAQVAGVLEGKIWSVLVHARKP